MSADRGLPLAALVSRQFVDMTRIRIEGLLAAFPKLVGSGKQHTYVETENVRYVYQPLEVPARRLPANHGPVHAPRMAPGVQTASMACAPAELSP